MKSDLTDRFFEAVIALRGDMFAYAFSITKQREDAEDAVHNAIVKAFEGLGKLKNESKLKPWLFAILRTEALQLLRQKKRFAALPEDIPGANSGDEERIDAENAVASLPRELREAVVLYYKLGYSTEEIAAIARIPRGTVMSRLHRAREHIKKQLEEGE
ncbi:MAG: RNA polymerase sigma factor [Clostridia bacterium]|nr:RNA polymerase sigma factor [Clostridia bacterium]